MKLLFFLYIIIFHFQNYGLDNEDKMKNYQLNDQNKNINIDTGVTICRDKLNQILELEKIAKTKELEAETKFQKEFFTYMLPIAKNTIDQINLMKIQEDEYDGIIAMHLENILFNFRYNKIPEQAGFVYRDFSSIINKKSIEFIIKFDISMIEFYLRQKRLLKKEIPEILDTYLTKNLESLTNNFEKIIHNLKTDMDEKEKNVYQKIDNAKIYIDDCKIYINEKEKKFESTIFNGINALSRITLSIIASAFVYSAYLRLLTMYKNHCEKKIKKYNYKYSKLIKNNLTHFFDGIIVLFGSYYILKTPSILNKIFQNKDLNHDKTVSCKK